jgi:hypothetical protein
MDIGILILRVLVGLTVAAHGAQKLFGIFGGHGLSGTSEFLESLGFRPGRFHAYLLGIAELAGGTLLAIGLFTPVAAAAIIGDRGHRRRALEERLLRLGGRLRARAGASGQRGCDRLLRPRRVLG